LQQELAQARPVRRLREAGRPGELRPAAVTQVALRAEPCVPPEEVVVVACQGASPQAAGEAAVRQAGQRAVVAVPAEPRAVEAEQGVQRAAQVSRLAEGAAPVLLQGAAQVSRLAEGAAPVLLQGAAVRLGASAAFSAHSDLRPAEPVRQ
jgi:hypothetical protein